MKKICSCCEKEFEAKNCGIYCLDCKVEYINKSTWFRNQMQLKKYRTEIEVK